MKGLKDHFMKPELLKTNQEIYRIEKVLRTRIKNKKKETYVKWKGYDNNFNQWIPYSEV